MTTPQVDIIVSSAEKVSPLLGDHCKDALFISPPRSLSTSFSLPHSESDPNSSYSSFGVSCDETSGIDEGLHASPSIKSKKKLKKPKKTRKNSPVPPLPFIPSLDSFFSTNSTSSPISTSEEHTGLIIDATGSEWATCNANITVPSQLAVRPNLSTLVELPGWKIQLDHKFDKSVRPVRPRWTRIVHLLPLAYRLWRYCDKLKTLGRPPFMNPLVSLKLCPNKGAPIGGIGCGTIGRGWQGDFNRWQLTPGLYSYKTVYADQFIVSIRRPGQSIFQKVLCFSESNGYVNSRRVKNSRTHLSAWDWSLDGKCGTYRALYPRAYTVYIFKEIGVQLTCRQISPILPHNYVDSSFPVGVFEWTAENLWMDPVQVSILFTFQNGTGEKSDSQGGHSNERFDIVPPSSSHLLFSEEYQSSLSHPEASSFDENVNASFPGESTIVRGVCMNHDSKPNPFQISVSALETESCEVTVIPHFFTNSSGKEIWETLYCNGCISTPTLQTPSRGAVSQEGETIGCGVCCSLSLKGANCTGSIQKASFALSWDMPIVDFLSTSHSRWYSRFFGDSGVMSPNISVYALMEYKNWERAIDEWQSPVLKDPALPKWYKSALFNELYYLADGGTLWIQSDPPDKTTGEFTSKVMENSSGDSANNNLRKKMHRKYSSKFPGSESLSMGRHNPLRDEVGLFAYLEGHEYRMYNTYDVHFYASYALAMLWPKLELSLQYEMGEALDMSNFKPWPTLMRGHTCIRKVPHAIPHDIGDPGEDPWLRVNSYNIHDTSTWKDLNTKFVLQMYRDYCITGERDFLFRMWPLMKVAIRHLQKYDRNCDGVIENDGFPDQTYDEWTVSGTSAYCGGLWLAALKVMCVVAKILDVSHEAEEFSLLFEKGRKAYIEKLWNGRYFKYDDDTHRNADSIMSDQCAGMWYLKACDISDGYAPDEYVISALKTVFEFNVQKFMGGSMGPVNGMFPDGVPDSSAMQSEEVWTGTAYAVAAHMLEMGLDREAFSTAAGVYNTVYNVVGMGFQTPEAYDIKGNFRALGYMRPLSIWAMQWALEKRKSKSFLYQSGKH